jgi:hypothetical protein
MALVLPKSIMPLVAKDKPVESGTVRRANTILKTFDFNLKEPVTVSGITANSLKAAYIEPSDDVINIGSNFLKDYVLSIDQRNKLLRIAKPN